NDTPKEMPEEPGAADMANLVREKGMNRAVMRMGRMGGGGFGMVNDASSRTGMATLVRGKVLTTSGQEVIGMIHIPTDFTLELDFGSLTLAAAKLRSITFAAETRKDKPAEAAPSSPSSNEKPPRTTPARESSAPRYFRQGSSIVVISPTGDHVTLY